ncbi:hypothetical protein [Antarcticibacterium sp. 1MA-6-2]|uniref:hypothetical protein n=1 Tax=Antarcticibacterium sp. 1MA-6-2 TaxID=2908210 RepID=UPI00288352BB|nr:hypothetical protein [Antarcticibacterium sp. 1MA-6-2]
MKKFLQLNRIPLLLTISAFLFYWSFAYDLDRGDFLKLVSLYAGLFFLSWKLIQLKKNSFWFLAGVALIFRFIFIGSIPNLSQDFYRFIWDGRMLLNGFNPFLSVPAEFITAGEAPVSQAKELYRGMGELNAGNYTNYPPLHQLIFALSAIIGGKSIIGSIIVMRVVIIAADFGILYFGKKILEKMQLLYTGSFGLFLIPL